MIKTYRLVKCRNQLGQVALSTSPVFWGPFCLASVICRELCDHSLCQETRPVHIPESSHSTGLALEEWPSLLQSPTCHPHVSANAIPALEPRHSPATSTPIFRWRRQHKMNLEPASMLRSKAFEILTHQDVAFMSICKYKRYCSAFSRVSEYCAYHLNHGRNPSASCYHSYFSPSVG